MNDFRLAREIEAAKVLREQLFALTDDEEVIVDMIDGELSLREIIRNMLAKIGEKSSQINGLVLYLEKLLDRKDRLESQINYSRSLIATALEMAGLQKLETDVATVSLKKVAPGLIVTDEAVIPSNFWKASDPKLDKAALKESLKAGEKIQGAELSNGGTTIQIRS